MRGQQRVGVVIPALNEEAAIGHVLDAIPSWVDDVVVVDNGSTDATAHNALAHGARVVDERRRGYGVACQTGIAALDDPDIVVFMDGDYSDSPDQMGRLVDPIAAEDADLVLGARVCDGPGAHPMTRTQRLGNRAVCRLIEWIWRVRFSDLGPFRAIRRSALETLGLRDQNFGWTVEMQVKAIRHGLCIQEVRTNYRHRIGRSKISGTLRGTIGAGTKILFVIFRAALRRG